MEGRLPSAEAKEGWGGAGGSAFPPVWGSGLVFACFFKSSFKDFFLIILIEWKGEMRRRERHRCERDSHTYPDRLGLEPIIEVCVLGQESNP